MRKIYILLTFFALMATLGACQNTASTETSTTTTSSQSSTSETTETTTSTATTATTTSEITTTSEETIIPLQEGLEEGLIFLFYGTYETVIGAADINGYFYPDGSYEIISSIWTYSSYDSVGEWTFADDVLTLVDDDTQEIITSSKVGEVYTLSYTSGGEEKVITATMNGTTTFIKQDRITEEEIIDQTKILLSRFDADDQLFQVTFYDDDSFSVSIPAYPTVTPEEGVWSYNDTDGLTMTKGEADVEVTFDGTNYHFLGSVAGFARNFSIARQDIENVLAGQLDVTISFPIEMLDDKYSSMTQQEWETLWEDEGISATGTFVPDSYPASSMDGLFDDILPKEYFAPVAAESRGSVIPVNYYSYVYSLYEEYAIPEEDWKPISKTCYVYLPSGYNVDTQYNVYYWLHGATGNETNLFTMNIDSSITSEVGEGDFVYLLDYLIANQLIEPAIFVAVTSNIDTTQLPDSQNRKFNVSYGNSSLIMELEKDLIPQLESTLSTYLDSQTYEDIVASREHRAFSGFSMGAAVVWDSLASNLDSIAFFGPMSNGCSPEIEDTETKFDQIYASMISGDNEGYDVGFIFAPNGVKDHTWDPHMRTFNELYVLSVTDENLEYGVNFYAHNPEFGTHTAKYAILGIYNSLKVFFDSDNNPTP